MFSTTAERTKIRDRLNELLKGCSIGDTVTHASILEVTGLPMEKARTLIYTTMAALNKSNGVVFTNVHGVGYQRLPTAGLPEVGASARKSITRKSRRAQKQIVNALGRANDVDPATRKRLHSEIGVLGLVELAAADKSFKRVAAALNEEVLVKRPPTPAELAQSLVATLKLK